jgi:hypothetical protein
MRLANYKIIAAITLAAFLFSGCASLMQGKDAVRPTPQIPVATYKVVVEEKKPFVQQPLRKGQMAPADGIWFDKESAKRLLIEITEGRVCAVKGQIDAQIIALHDEQLKFLVESNDLYRKEIESQKKWNSVKMVLSVVSTIAGIIIGVLVAK